MVKNLGSAGSLSLCFKRWSKLLERIARVNEAVNSGKDIELDPQDPDQDPDHEEQPGQEQGLTEKQETDSVQDIKVLSSRLDKTEQSLDSLGRDQSSLNYMSGQQIISL